MYAVSVIIPIYNVERYIERCAVSLFEQSLSNIEFIFVNDKTPDSSMEALRKVCSRYASLAANIKIIDHERNMGSAYTRITGIKSAQGKYIVFCDSDDWIEHDMFEKLYAKAESGSFDVVYCNYLIEYPYKTVRSTLVNTNNIRDYQKMLLCGILPSFSWMRLYNREKLIKYIDKLYIPGVNMWEDSMMNILLSFFINKVTFIDYAGYHYNQCNSNAYTSVWSDESKQNIFAVVENVTSFVEERSEFLPALSFYRLSALYSIISHSDLSQMRTLIWPWVDDFAFVWKHPNMPFLNKCVCMLYEMRCYNIVVGIVNLKKRFKLMLWGK